MITYAPPLPETIASTDIRVVHSQILENFVVDNEELERLESLLDQFNIFEAIGAVRQELRHSDFLAFLLDPQQSHGLGDVFVKRLLQKVLVTARDSAWPVTPIDFDVWSLDQTIVQREWHHIDILLTDDLNKFVVIIENKIGTGEHDEQLARYWRSVNERYAGWRVVGLYLTPDGDSPSDTRYIDVSYKLIAELVQYLADSRKSTLGTDVQTLMMHYAQMLRRHIVNESEIAELCRRIYQKHKPALDLIYEHRPDQQAAIRELVERLIRERQDLVFNERSSKSYIDFIPEEWDWQIPLYFEFINAPNGLKLILSIAPGDQSVRQELLNTALAAQREQKLFPTADKTLWTKFNTIFSLKLLTPNDYTGTMDEIEKKVSQKWQRFLEDELPDIRRVMRPVVTAHHSATP